MDEMYLALLQQLASVELGIRCYATWPYTVDTKQTGGTTYI
jgi:hypothetical protein